LITGTIAWRIAVFLTGNAYFNFCGSYPSNELITIPACYYAYDISWAWLVLIVPVIWILGVLLGYFLGQWLNFFNQFGKFATIGFTNFAVTAGALNILISITNYTSGIGYAIISGASFVFGVISSYIWNKYWAFKSNNNQGGGQEFIKFFAVTIIAFIISVSVASVVVNYINPLGGMDLQQWANIGTIAGSAVALVFSFIGFKVAVFRQ
jgi:putative flippase GtrA